MLTEFERVAWDRRESAADHKPQMALKAALDQLERGEFGDVKHVLVVVVETDDDGGDVVGMLQAESLSALVAEGALGRAIMMQARAKTT